MFQSIKNNRVRKNVGFRNKSQTKASRRVVLNWEGALEDRRLMATLTLTPSNNIGYLSGAGFNNSVSVSIASGNYIFEDTNLLDPMVLVPQIGTALTAVPLPFGANGFSISAVALTKSITVQTLDGNDVVTLTGDGTFGTLIVHGGEGGDYINATAMATPITAYGDGGDDNLDGGIGNDTLDGGDGNDFFFGNAGDDLLNGGTGKDFLDGGDGVDQLYGGSETDHLYPGTTFGSNSEYVDGGTGLDEVIFEFSGTSGLIRRFIGDVNVSELNAANATNFISNDVELISCFANTTTANATGMNVSILDMSGSVANHIFVNFTDPNDQNTLTMYGTNGPDKISAASAPPIGSLYIDPGAAINMPWGTVRASTPSSPTILNTLVIQGEDGNDTIEVANVLSLGAFGWNVSLDGGSGNDYLTADATLNGGAGDDTFVVPNGTNTIDGGTGNDTILVTGSEFTDSITVTQNATVNISVTSGSVTTSSINTVTNVEVINISALAGNDTILSNGTGTIATYVFGDDGNDTINATGLAALATIYGGSGNDIITGGSAVDYIYGEAGQDQIIGGPGNDQLSGGEDSDTFVWNSGDGNDTIDGGTGTDALITNGTSGSDCFTIAPDGTFVTQARVTIEVPTLAQNGSLLAGNLEHVSLVGAAGADLFQVKSLVPTPVVAVDIDMGADAGVQDMAIVTTSNAGSVLTATPSATNATVDVNGLSALVRLYNNTLDDVLAIQGGYGDDKISVSPQTLTLIQVQVDGGGGNDLITGSTMASGGDGNDTIIGTPGPDTLLGGMGDDSISGFGDDDLILGDAISNGGLIGLTADFTCSSGEVIIPFAILPITDVDGGNDTLLGGTGNDSIQGNGGDDSILGGTGDDSIYGGLGNDYIEGNTGDDSLCGGPDIDELVDATLDDSDTIFGGNGNDAINGDAGDDFLNGGVGNDQLWGNDGNDTIGVFVYNGVTQFEPGNDSMIGGLGDDLIAGALVDSAGKPVNDGNDVMFGQEGNDTIWGGAGGDMIYGGEGDDVMLGGTPLTANTLHAPRNGKLPNDGNDTMFGGNGFDKVDGGNNNNLLDAGNDGIRETVLGGKGNDMGYSHTLQDPVKFDVLALDGGFNHKFCDGGLEEPPVPAASCTYIDWAIPSNFLTGVKTLKNGDIVEHPSLDYRTKPNNGPNGPVIKSVKIQSSKVTVSKTTLAKSAVSKSSTSFAGKSKTVGKLSSGLGKLQVAKG